MAVPAGTALDSGGLEPGVFGPAYGAPALLIPEGGVFYALFRPQQFFSLPYSIFAQNLL
jgi:hypothetical protein